MNCKEGCEHARENSVGDYADKALRTNSPYQPSLRLLMSRKCDHLVGVCPQRAATVMPQDGALGTDAPYQVQGFKDRG